MQQEACRALWSLACNADKQVKIGAAGGIDALLAAIKAHTHSAGVQEEACSALYNIAYNKKDKKGKIAETVVAAMKAHKVNALVHECAFRALGSLADYTFNDNEVKVAEAGGIAAVIKNKCRNESAHGERDGAGMGVSGSDKRRSQRREPAQDCRSRRHRRSFNSNRRSTHTHIVVH